MVDLCRRAITRSKQHFGVICAAIFCMLAPAACGSTNSATNTGSSAASGPSTLVKFSACMRSHGVPDFPDPSTTETPNSFGIDGYNFDLPANLSQQAPAYESANTACQRLIGGGPGGAARNPALAARAKRAALARAECMRAHGVPTFPDPTVSAGGGGITVKSGGPGIDPRSPAFQQAQKICARS
jgi:hypothetical protein